MGIKYKYKRRDEKEIDKSCNNTQKLTNYFCCSLDNLHYYIKTFWTDIYM